MGLEDPDRLARLDQQRLRIAEAGEHGHDPVVTRPVAGGAPGAAINDQRLGILRDFGVEVVHQHAKRRLGLPAPRVKPRSTWRPDAAGVFRGGAA